MKTLFGNPMNEDEDSFWTLFGNKDGVRVATSSISDSLFFIHMARKWLNING